MATTTIEARCNTFPTRLAFVLSRPDHEQLNAVFARAATLLYDLFLTVCRCGRKQSLQNERPSMSAKMCSWGRGLTTPAQSGASCFELQILWNWGPVSTAECHLVFSLKEQS